VAVMREGRGLSGRRGFVRGTLPWMRDERARLKRRARALLVSAAFSGGFMAGVGCKGTPPPTEVMSYQAVCERAAALSCAHETVDECVAQAQNVANIAQGAGCGAEFDRSFQCTYAHPDQCDGGLVQDKACVQAGQTLDDCLLTSDPASLCDVTADDPCNRCVCKECVCGADCQRATGGWVACESACTLSDAGDFTACFSACTAATSPSFQKYLACPGSSVCAAACSADGGVRGP